MTFTFRGKSFNIFRSMQSGQLALKSRFFYRVFQKNVSSRTWCDCSKIFEGLEKYENKSL